MKHLASEKDIGKFVEYREPDEHGVMINKKVVLSGIKRSTFKSEYDVCYLFNGRVEKVGMLDEIIKVYEELEHTGAAGVWGMQHGQCRP